MYTFLYPLDARHPDPPQLGPSDSPVGISEIDFAGVGDGYARAIGCLADKSLWGNKVPGTGFREWGRRPVEKTNLASFSRVAKIMSIRLPHTAFRLKPA
jgi:hypothetical protein